MNLSVINNKQTITKNGETIIDFAEPTFVYKYSDSFSVKKTIQVPEEYDMRPDLIAYVTLGNENYMDLLLKINEISSPLDVRTGDILIIPDLTSVTKFLVTPTKEQNLNTLDLKTKTQTIDESRLKELERISSKLNNGSKQNIRTNEISTDNIVISNGNMHL